MKGGKKMKNVMIFCLSILFTCSGLVSIISAQDLDNLYIEKVACPMTVSVGTPLDVTVTVKNEGPATTINRFAVALSGNPLNSLGGIGVWGPFPRNKTVNVPAYGTKTFTLRIVSSVPTSLKNKFAVAGLSLIEDDPEEPNKLKAGGGCMVQVVGSP